MATNLYGGSCTPNIGGVKDFYTKEEVNRLLNTKANTSTVYNRLYLDGRFQSIDNSIALLTSTKISQSQLNSELNSLQDEIETDAAGVYATIATTYTKGEVDGLISGININPDNYVLNNPTTTQQNTIDPGSNNIIPLTVRGSSTNSTVFRWLDNTGDVIGYVSNNGTVTLESRLDVGRLVSNGDFAINTSGKRITGVGVPVLGSDAVPFGYLQTYVVDLVEELTRPEDLGFYSLDGGTY